MPGGGPQTETIAITQGHLPPNAESPPAAPIADYELVDGLSLGPVPTRISFRSGRLSVLRGRGWSLGARV
jgi:hypothetical protein